MTHPVVTDWLDRAQARLDAAPAGPWSAPGHYLEHGDREVLGELCMEQEVVDLIVAAPTDLARLIEAVRTVLDIADELAEQPATARALTTAARLHDAVYTALFPAPEAPRD